MKKTWKRLRLLAMICVLLAQGLIPLPAQGTTSTTDEVNFSLPGGTYDGPILVTMSSTTGKFCFTVDGSGLFEYVSGTPEPQEEPTTEEPTTEEPATDEPTTEAPTTEGSPTTEAPPTTELPTIETTTELPTIETTTELPTIETTTELPTIETTTEGSQTTEATTIELPTAEPETTDISLKDQSEIKIPQGVPYTIDDNDVIAIDANGNFYASTRGVRSRGVGDDNNTHYRLRGINVAGSYTFLITESCTINAIAYASIDGVVTELGWFTKITYNITHSGSEARDQVAFSPAGGTYTDAQRVKLYAPAGWKILYTTDGSELQIDGRPLSMCSNVPGVALPGTVYTGPIAFNETTTIHAVAYKENVDPNTGKKNGQEYGYQFTDQAVQTYIFGAPAYTLALTAPTFDAVEEGYDQPEAKPITIVSSGNMNAHITSMTLSGDNAECFILNKTDGAEIAAGTTDSETYAIQPAAGLGVGEYTAVVTAAYNDGATASSAVRFTVNKKRYTIHLEDGSPDGYLMVPTGDTACEGDTVFVQPYGYEDYIFLGIYVEDADGNPVDVTDRFIMPASDVWVYPQLADGYSIQVVMDEGIDMAMMNVEGRMYMPDDAVAMPGQQVDMMPYCWDGEHELGSVLVTGEDGASIACTMGQDEYSEETVYSFIMPNQPVTVRISVKGAYPEFGAASFTLPSDVLTIEESAFSGDESISVVEIPAGCQSIGKEAFKDCANLCKIRIPASCQIGENAFAGCREVFIYGEANSPAEEYCKNHDNCTFVAE